MHKKIDENAGWDNRGGPAGLVWRICCSGRASSASCWKRRRGSTSKSECGQVCWNKGRGPAEELGLGERMMRQGLMHYGVELRFGDAGTASILRI